MRAFLLSLFMTVWTVGAYAALGDEYVKVDMGGASASQSNPADAGDFGGKPCGAGYAIDGSATNNLAAGWNDGKLKDSQGGPAESNTLDNGANWWLLDFGTAKSVDAVSITFQDARSTRFIIEFFNDDPTSVTEPAAKFEVTNGSTAFETVFDETQTYRYMRLNFLEAVNYAWGIKIFEVEPYYNEIKSKASAVRFVADNTGSSTVVKGRPTTLTVKAYDAAGNYLGDINAFTLTSSASGITIDGHSVTAAEIGGAEFAVNMGGKTLTASIDVVSPISEMECLVYNDGPWKTTITASPDPYTETGPTHLIENIVDQDETTQGGWSDGALGGSNTITKGDARLTVDLKRACNIRAVKAVNQDAVINGYTIEFYAGNPDVGTAPAPLYSFDYTTANTADRSVEEIYLPKTVEGARYVRFMITSIKNHDWGGRFFELCFYGPDNAGIEIKELVLSTNRSVVGRTDYIKVQAVTSDGIVVYDNLDATFTVKDKADALSIGSKTAQGYPVTGIEEAVVPVTFTADPRGNGPMTASANIIVANPLGEHVCMVNHSNNKLSVAHQSNRFAPYNADNSINGLTDNDSFLSGWDAANLSVTADGSLDRHNNWWIVDLGRTANIGAVRVTWTANYASRYKIEVFGPDVKLWEEYRTNPAAADGLAMYHQEFSYEGPAGGHTDIVTFDEIVYGAQRIRITMLEAATENGIQWYEVCVLGRENPDFTINSLALVRKDINVGETRAYEVYGYTNSGYTISGLDGAMLEIAPDASAYAGQIRIEADGRITGVKKGITPIVLKWENLTTETFMEVTTKDWSNTVNIARKYRTSDPSAKSKNGFTKGNPLSDAWSAGIKGAENESVKGLIDGDWMSWTITAEETRAAEKPYVVIDLGCEYPVNEFNIHWNADGDGEGNGSYIMLSGNYRVYASTDKENWGTPVYTVENRPASTYDVDRHVFEKKTARYVKFEFTSPKIYNQRIAINEITIGGPEFYNAEADSYADYPDSRVLMVTTPSFDRSNVLDRQIDNNWIVTSTNVNAKNPLMLSYLAIDCYGRSYLPEGAEVKICRVNDDGSIGEPINPLTDADGNPKLHHYRNIHWPVSVYEPKGIGQEKVRAVITGSGLTPALTTDLTIYTISDRGNVNRYATAYDNAVNYSPGWESGDRTGDRDLTFLGTAPKNASDGSYGSWYAIGYYGDGDHMGSTYKYPANTVLPRPYELVMDYRGVDYASNPAADRFVTELDMIGVQFEGAFARDYNVYLLHCDDNGVVPADAEWEKVASFVNLQSMGVGQVETQRIYPANDDGSPRLDGDGRIIPWTDVAAVKIEMITTGTQWGIKMMESAIYGKLNKVVLPLAMAQVRYDDRAAAQPADDGRYHSFDLALSTPYSETDYVQSELETLKDELPGVDRYRVSVRMRSFDGSDWTLTPFTAGTVPTGVTCSGTSVENVAVSEDGSCTFEVSADIMKDHMVNDIIIKNVDPSKAYRAYAVPLDKDGNQPTAIAVNNSLITDLTAPAAAFVADGPIKVRAVDATIANADQLMTDNGAAMSLGSKADGRRSYFNKVNKTVAAGHFEPLDVTDEVATTWTIGYRTDITVDGMPHGFETVLDKADAAATVNVNNRSASIEYLPLHTVGHTAAEVDGSLSGAPSDIKSIALNSLDTGAKISVVSANTVTYSLMDKRASSAVKTSEEVLLDQGDIDRVLFEEAEVSHTEKAIFYADFDGTNVWDALIRHTLLERDANIETPLNKFVGFYATNNAHCIASEKGGVCAGGFPLDGNDERFAEFSIPGYVPEESNYSSAAADGGVVGVRLSHISDVAAVEELETVDPIYTLLAAEYPFALAPLVSDGDNNVTVGTSQAGSVLTVPGGRTAAVAVAATRAIPANLQVISAPTVVRTEINVNENNLTGIADATSAAAEPLSVYPNPAESLVTVTAGQPLGKVEIFTLDGVRAICGQTCGASTTIDVSGLIPGIYLVRTAGAVTRLVKR